MSAQVRRAALACLADDEPAMIVEVHATRGSVPREAGTRMLVSTSACAGTLGGGHLELKAIAQARALLAGEPNIPSTAHYPLGPALGQCCGGAVTLGFSRLDRESLAGWPEEPVRFHLQLYGAGHVGRAIARALAPLHVSVTWIDSRADEFDAGNERFRNDSPALIRRVIVDADEPIEAEVADAQTGAFYLVLTHRHDLDLAITEAVLRRGDFGYLGLIGSQTKKQRFAHQLERRGFAHALIERITCPIGIPGIDGKEPEVIAAAVIAQLLLVAQAGSASDAPMRRG